MTPDQLNQNLGLEGVEASVFVKLPNCFQFAAKVERQIYEQIKFSITVT